jgi:Double zinc ribbon
MLLNFKDRMFRLSEDESLSPLSILVIILLDIFLLTVLFQGLDAQSRLLTNPDQYIPYICQEIIIDKEWTENNRLDKLSDIVIGYHRETYNEVSQPGKMAPICKELVDAINTVKTDKEITKLFEERNQLLTLREEIKNNLSDVGSLSEVRTNPKYIALSNQILAVNQRINANPKAIILWQVIGQSVAKQEIVIQSLRSYRYFFPLYEVLWQFLFLLPLLVLFYLWYQKSANKNRLQGLISTHLLIVVSIPIFLKIIKFVLDIIPRQIIKNFIDLLDSLKLIAIWYYIVIGIAIGISILLIYVLQKHLFNRGKIIEKRIRNRNCIGCGKKLPAHDQHCFTCGADQYQVCPQCGQLTYVNSQYCRECGKKIDK